MDDDLLKGNSGLRVRGSVAFTGVRVKPTDNVTEGVMVLLGNILRDESAQLDTSRLSALN